MYVITGLSALIHGIPLASIVYIVLLLLLWISKKRSIKKFRIIEFAFILYIVAILKITGIIGMQFNIKWFKNSLGSLGFYSPLGEGELKMLVLNMVLFIPFGILIPIVIRTLRWNWLRVFIVGFSFSIAIEFLQMFAGRMSEINDVLMNSLGTFAGYWIFWILQYVRKLKVKKISNY